MTLDFICRVKSGTERRSLVEAARRVTSAWLPFSLESTRPRRKRSAVATTRPIMPYLFVTATHDEMIRLLQHRDIFGPVWFIPARIAPSINAYRAEVEKAFAENLHEYLTDARAFHCTFKPGQSVRLKQKGIDLFDATFLSVSDDGRYNLEAEMLGRKVGITAEPHHVIA